MTRLASTLSERYLFQNVEREDRTNNQLVAAVVITVANTVVLEVNTIPVVVKLAAGVVVLGGCIYCNVIHMSNRSCLKLTRVGTVCVVGAVVVVVVVLETLRFQISKTQKLGFVIGADSAPMHFSTD
jgi:hypothetical protein